MNKYIFDEWNLIFSLLNELIIVQRTSIVQCEKKI